MDGLVTVKTKKPRGQESKDFIGFNLDMIVAFEYTEGEGQEAELIIDFAAPMPMAPEQPGGFYRRVYTDKKAKVVAKYLFEVSRELYVLDK